LELACKQAPIDHDVEPSTHYDYHPLKYLFTKTRFQMVLFFPIQQNLDCINDSGLILGKLKFVSSKSGYIFQADNASIMLSQSEQSAIDAKLTSLNLGDEGIGMQDDD
jgi:hypothetical protein